MLTGLLSIDLFPAEKISLRQANLNGAQQSCLITRLSSKATSNAHAEESPKFYGWKEYDKNSYHRRTNTSGIIQMGLRENQGITSFMEEIGGRKVEFESDRIVIAAGPTAAHDGLTFCLADPGEAFLLPTTYYPGFDGDLKWRTGEEPIAVECRSFNNFQVNLTALKRPIVMIGLET